MSIPSSWTEDRIQTLARLWQEGASASQIARSLGGVTRNAVIGKIHRLGLSGRAKPSPPVAQLAKPKQERRPRSVRAASPPRCIVASIGAAPAGPPAMTGLATMVSVRRSQCRWPIGDPLADDFRLCGRPAERGAYCAPHGALAYRPSDRDDLLRIAGLF